MERQYVGQGAYAGGAAGNVISAGRRAGTLRSASGEDRPPLGYASSGAADSAQQAHQARFGRRASPGGTPSGDGMEMDPPARYQPSAGAPPAASRPAAGVPRPSGTPPAAGALGGGVGGGGGGAGVGAGSKLAGLQRLKDASTARLVSRIPSANGRSSGPSGSGYVPSAMTHQQPARALPGRAPSGGSSTGIANGYGAANGGGSAAGARSASSGPFLAAAGRPPSGRSTGSATGYGTGSTATAGSSGYGSRAAASGGSSSGARQPSSGYGYGSSAAAGAAGAGSRQQPPQPQRPSSGYSGGGGTAARSQPSSGYGSRGGSGGGNGVVPSAADYDYEDGFGRPAAAAATAATGSAAARRPAAAPVQSRAPAARPQPQPEPEPYEPAAGFGGGGGGGFGGGFGSGSIPPGAEEADAAAAGPMVECPTCGRRFNEQAYCKHAKICEKVFATKRKPVNMAAKRLEGTEAVKYFDLRKGVPKSEAKPGAAGPGAAAGGRGAAGGRAGGGLDDRPLPGSKVPKWKAQSEHLRAAMSANRQIADAKAKGMDIKDIKFDTGPSAPDDRVQCPHCGRKFAELTAERHIPKCKDTMAKPNRLAARGGRGAHMRR